MGTPKRKQIENAWWEKPNPSEIHDGVFVTVGMMTCPK
jgi:hypothetical protein